MPTPLKAVKAKDRHHAGCCTYCLSVFIVFIWFVYRPWCRVSPSGIDVRWAQVMDSW